MKMEKANNRFTELFRRNITLWRTGKAGKWDGATQDFRRTALDAANYMQATTYMAGRLMLVKDVLNLEEEQIIPATCAISKIRCMDKSGESKNTATETKGESAWISVNDKLPTDMDLDWVVVQVVANNGYKWPIPKVAAYIKFLDDWYTESEGWLKKENNGCFEVTHWTPLPEFPEEVER